MSKHEGAKKKDVGGEQTVEYHVRKLDKLSGKKAKIYGVVLNDNEDGFTQFYKQFDTRYNKYVASIIRTISTMSSTAGVLDGFFRPGEGGSDRKQVGCLPNYDEPNPPLRLFCIFYSSPQNVVIIVGGGRKEAPTWQDSPDLLPIGNLAIAIYDDMEKNDLFDFFKNEPKLKELYARQLKVDFTRKK